MGRREILESTCWIPEVQGSLGEGGKAGELSTLIYGVRAPRGMATGWGLEHGPGPSLQPQDDHGLLFLKNSKPQMASSASPV